MHAPRRALALACVVAALALARASLYGRAPVLRQPHPAQHAHAHAHAHVPHHAQHHVPHHQRQFQRHHARAQQPPAPHMQPLPQPLPQPPPPQPRAQPQREEFDSEERSAPGPGQGAGPAVAAAAAAATATATAGGSAFAAALATGGGAAAAAAAAGPGLESPYSKRRPGRHVCTREQVVPDRTVETYSKPSYIPYQKACNDHSGMCNAVRIVYHEAYRTEQKMHFKKQTTYICCPGWMQAHKHQHGCRKAICTNPCLNKGSCVQPQTCSCSPGFTGPQCETDINECREKPCDHTCVNTNGSFQCYCHDGFDLQEDGRTCRSRGNITATEAKDLLDYELISQRLLRLEEEMHTKKQTSPTTDLPIRELTNKIESMMQRILDLQDQLDNVKRSQASAHRTLQIVQAYLPQMERINPLCKQVSTIEQEVQSCTCRSGMRYRFKPHNLS